MINLFIEFRNIIELHRDKTNKMACVPSKDSDQLGHRPVWSESSLCTQWVAKEPSFLQAEIKDFDQTGRMPRLIRVFAGRKGHFVGFVTMRLGYIIQQWKNNKIKI